MSAKHRVLVMMFEVLASMSSVNEFPDGLASLANKKFIKQVISSVMPVQT